MDINIETCKCCGAVIPPRAEFGLTRTQQRVYDYIARHPGCTMDRIMNGVYADARDGGPTFSNTIAVHIHNINNKLTGLRIQCSGPGPGATYRLIKL